EPEVLSEPMEDAVQRPRELAAVEPPLAENPVRLAACLGRRQSSSRVQPGGGGQYGGCSSCGCGGTAGSGAGDTACPLGCQPGGGGQYGGCSVPGPGYPGAGGRYSLTGSDAPSVPSRSASSRRSKPSLRTRRSMYRTVANAATAGVV